MVGQSRSTTATDEWNGNAGAKEVTGAGAAFIPLHAHDRRLAKAAHRARCSAQLGEIHVKDTTRVLHRGMYALD